MKNLLLAISLFHLLSCSSDVTTEPEPRKILVIEPPAIDFGTVKCPGRQTARFTLKNQTDRTVTITKIGGSCACHSFLLGDKRIINRATIAVPFAPQEARELSFKFEVRPLNQELVVRVEANEGTGAAASLTCYGLAPFEVRPPEHDFGDVQKGTKHPWKTRVVSVTGKPFELYKSNPSITLKPIGGGGTGKAATWEITGILHAAVQGQNSEEHRIDTDVKDVPLIMITLNANVLRRIDLPPVLNIAVRDKEPVKYEFTPTIRDSTFRIKSCRLDPPIHGLAASTDGKTVSIQGRPTMGRMARVKLVVSFSDATYPDESIRVLLIRR